MDSARCPYCRDLFVPENGLLPTHFLDLYQGTVECDGSGTVANAALENCRRSGA